MAVFRIQNVWVRMSLVMLFWFCGLKSFCPWKHNKIFLLLSLSWFFCKPCNMRCTYLIFHFWEKSRQNEIQWSDQNPCTKRKTSLKRTKMFIRKKKFFGLKLYAKLYDLCIFHRGSNIDTEFRYSGIELNTKFRYWKLGNSGILEASIKCNFWTYSN